MGLLVENDDPDILTLAAAAILGTVLFAQPRVNPMLLKNTKETPIRMIKEILEKRVNNPTEGVPHTRTVVLRHDPRVVRISNFLRPAECQHLLDLAAPRLKPSQTGGGRISNRRTSYGTFLERGCKSGDPIVEAIEIRAAELMRVPRSHLDPIQVLRYKPGQQFKAHTDGHGRTDTLCIYFNDDFTGGETHFPNLGLSVKGPPGTAFHWKTYLDAEHAEKDIPDKRTKHTGE